MGNIGFGGKQPFPSGRCASYQQTGGSSPISVTLPDSDQVNSIISVVKLCEARCEVSFTKWGIGVEV